MEPPTFGDGTVPGHPHPLSFGSRVPIGADDTTKGLLARDTHFFPRQHILYPSVPLTKTFWEVLWYGIARRDVT